MIIAASQPTYLPWMGYFAMIDSCDQFIILDSMQMMRESFHRRNRIEDSKGSELWLTIPIGKQNFTLLNETRIFNFDWIKKHKAAFQSNYSKSPFFKETNEWFTNILASKFETLAELNSNIIVDLCEKLEMTTPFCFLSSFKYDKDLKKDHLLAFLVKNQGGNIYLSSQGSAGYIEEKSGGGQLIKEGLGLQYFHYEHPIYPQKRDPFTPYLCILDLLANVGFDKALEVIRSGIKESWDYRTYRKEIMNLEN